MMTPRGCLETSETDYPVTRHHMPGWGIIQLHRCGNQKNCHRPNMFRQSIHEKKKNVRTSGVPAEFRSDNLSDWSQKRHVFGRFHVVKHINTLRYDFGAMNHWPTERIFSRQFFFFRKLMITHSWQFILFFYRLLLKNRLKKKALQLIVLPQAETNVSYRIPWTSRSLRLTQSCRLKRYVSYSHLHTIRWSPKEITQHRALVNTNVNVY
jgi:hypothetical protein